MLQHIFQPFLFVVLTLICIGIVYALGKIPFGKTKTKPIGRFYATLLMLPSLMFHALVSFLKPFDLEQKPNASETPGLRSIILVLAATFAAIVVFADGYNCLQALSALWDIGFNLPDIPLLSYSMGWLFLALSGVTGFIYLETLHVVSDEARIFNITKDNEDTFKRIVFWTFFLSLAASIAFNALKPAYLTDSESGITFILRVAVFVLLGCLLPLVMALSVYIIALGLQAVVSIYLMVACFLAATLARILDFLISDFSQGELPQNEDHPALTFPADPVLLVPVSEPEAPPVREPDKKKQPDKDKKEKFNVERVWSVKHTKRLIPLSAVEETLTEDHENGNHDSLDNSNHHSQAEPVIERKSHKKPTGKKPAASRKSKSTSPTPLHTASGRGRSKKVATK